MLSELRPTSETFAADTGWKIEPHGACRGEVCVPLPPGALGDGRVDVELVAGRLGMGIVAEDGRWAVGPASLGGRALASVEAPDLELQTFDGRPFRLSSLRGTRHVLVAWAPY